MTYVVAGDRVLFPGATKLTPGYVEIDGETIVAAGSGSPPRTPDERWDGIVSPGFVDVHSHGGGGANFGDGPDGVRTVLATHRSHGTTTMVASLVTGAVADLVGQIAMLNPFVRTGDLAGIHLEGPFLSPSYKGAHPADKLIDPDPDSLARLLDAGVGTVRMVTIAPELPHALEAIADLARRGVVAAVGHTAADHATTLAAIDAGATGATHLFNAMPELLHRAPGPVLALWHDPRVWCELIVDGVHTPAPLPAHVIATIPRRVVLITDAMAAAGSADGDYTLGELAVEVRDGVARLAGQTTIAGSTLTLDKAVRTCVAAGVDVVTALTAATANPASYLGLTDVGRLAEGCRADIVELDDTLKVRRILRRGSPQK